MGGQDVPRIASSLEKDILAVEWAYWQYYRATDCEAFLTPLPDAASIYTVLTQIDDACPFARRDG